MMRRYLSMLCALAVTACASVGPTTTGPGPADSVPPPVASPSAAVAPDGGQLTVILRMPPRFRVQTPESVTTSTPLNGADGAGSAAGSHDTVQDLLTDPVARVADDVSALVVETSGTTRSSRVLLPEVPNKYEDYRAIDWGKKGQLFEIWTARWGIRYIKTAPTTYQVYYAARSSLTNTLDTKVVGEASCSYGSDRDGAPTYDELLANGGALLKSTLDDAVSFCSRAMRLRIFGNKAMSISEAMELLSSEDPYELELAVQTLELHPVLAEQELDAIADKIAADQNTKEATRMRDVDRLCRVLGKSGNPRYKPFLTDLAATATNHRLKDDAASAARRLPPPIGSAYSPPATQPDAMPKPADTKQ